MRAPRLLPVLLPILMAAPLVAGDEPDPLAALQHGQVSLLLRPRYEAVDDRGARRTADALTDRLVLGYRTGAWQGLSAYVEFESVTALQTPPRYFVPQTGYGNPSRAAVVDPALTQVNQLYLAWKGLQVGRMAVNLDDQRFLGTVGWRQNDQTFTGASFANATWIPRTSFTVARFTQVAPITGITRDLRLDVVNARVALWTGTHVSLFRYASEELSAPAASLAHTGARLEGGWKALRFEASYAVQRPWREATAATTPEAGYRLAGLGWAFTPSHTVMLEQEALEPGFRTPYATLHAWNGWADRFLTTPATGLRDRFVRYRGKLGAWSLEASVHGFHAQAEG
ncbi:MAG TPA: hypothetical protein VFM16_05540, partial [Holophagaceae bacterium]|nr:hypothetical protein [Holophagaceae bacterium]